MRRTWAEHFLRNEFVASALLGGALVLWATCYGGRATLEPLLSENRAALYGTAASITGALLGFLITTVTIIQGIVANPGFRRLRASSQYPTLWAVFKWTIRMLALTCIGLLLALAIDRDSEPYWLIFHLVVWLLLACVFLVGRSIWILEQVLAIAAQPTDADVAAEQPSADA